MTVPKYCLTSIGYSRRAVVHIAEEDPLLLKVLRGSCGIPLIYWAVTPARCVLGFGDAELLVGLHHLFGELVPLVDLLALGRR